MNKPLTLAANNLTAIAKSTTPKAFLTTPKPVLPNIFSIFDEDFKTAYTKITFKIIAMTIFSA